MSALKKIFVASAMLFALIGAISLMKQAASRKKERAAVTADERPAPILEEEQREERIAELLSPAHDQIAEEEVDHVWRLFTTGKKKLPIVETIRYKSRVPWIKGRPAWIADYAAHFSTSRHFIARSLNGKRDYYSQTVSSGDQFNVLKPDKNIHFHLVVDLSRCKMWFYYYDTDADERVLLKTYRVGLGCFNADSDSGLLTPEGHFLLGDKVVTYKAGMQGHFRDESVEMVQVFGTRWIPFVEKNGEGEGNPRGYGFHGAPWVYDPETKSYREAIETIGKYNSDGCIRLSQEDIEELYAIVITKPTTVEIISDYHKAELPGINVDR